MQTFKLIHITFITLLTIIKTKKVFINPYETFIFETRVPKNHLFKFEYHEEQNLSPEVSIYNDQNKEVLTSTEVYMVMHAGSEEDTIYRIEIKNPLNKKMTLYFRVPDCDKEMHSELGPITEKDIQAEFEEALDKNIKEQHEYLKTLEEHEILTRRTHRDVALFLVFEFVSCCALLYYLHRKTQSLFEKRQRA